MIEPIAYCQKLDGKSNAHLISFNDGKDYVVKFFQQDIGKTLPNEWVSYCLGRYLGLPIPFAQIVEIPHEFSAQIPELANINGSQHQFASLYVPGCKNGHEVTNVSYIINDHSLASIIVFDYWLSNKDRTRKNIIFQEKQNQHNLWVIDHAEIFNSYNWALEDLENLPIKRIKSTAHEIIAQFIKDERSFFEQIEIIQTIPIFLLEEITNLIPDDWQVTNEEKTAIVSTLVNRRRKTLPNLIREFIKKVYRPIHHNLE